MLLVKKETQTIAVTIAEDQRNDRFYKLHKLASTNCHTNVTSTATWHRGEIGFFEVCQADGLGFGSRSWPKFFCACDFGFVRFFRNFFNVSERSPSIFYILHQNACSKNPKGPLLHFLALCDLRRLQKKFGKLLSSFGYCRREYLIL